MSKRTFRKNPQKAVKTPDYPTLDEFDGGRRRFLSQIGAALLGAGTLSAALAACGDRPLDQNPDTRPEHLAGVKREPDARLDTRPLEPDAGPLSGGAPQPDARLDSKQPDAEPMAGDPAQPDARIDSYRPDPLTGESPAPDARVDTYRPDPVAGGKPGPDARGDAT
jgi:hypothetical protein